MVKSGTTGIKNFEIIAHALFAKQKILQKIIHEICHKIKNLC